MNFDRINKPDTVLSDQDLKDLLYQIQTTDGQVLSKLKLEKMQNLLSQKILDLDKTFFQALFTIVKSSLKWKKYGGDLLVIGLIPNLIALELQQSEQMIEVILLTIYNEYRHLIVEQPVGAIVPKYYEIEIREAKKNIAYEQLTQINPSNMTLIYQFLVELIYRNLLKLDINGLKQVVRMGLIFCGCRFADLKNQTLLYENSSLHQHILTDRTIEYLLFTATTIQMNKKDLRADTLIDQLSKKAANECKFGVASLAQSIKELNAPLYDIF